MVDDPCLLWPFSYYRYFIAPIVYICILLAIVASICVTSFLYTRYEYTDADITAQEDLGVTITDSETNERDFYLYSSWLFMILTVLVVLVVIVCRNEIKAAIRVYKCASDAIKVCWPGSRRTLALHRPASAASLYASIKGMLSPVSCRNLLVRIAAIQLTS